MTECLVWAVIVAMIYAGIATVSDWRRFEPETSAAAFGIILDRWSFMPDYLTWIGVPLAVIVWIHSRYAVRRRSPIGQGGDEYRAFDAGPDAQPSQLGTFVCLYLAAMIVAGLGRVAVVQCWMRGECHAFIWYQGALYSAALLIWPLLLLLLRRAVWSLMRGRWRG